MIGPVTDELAELREVSGRGHQRLAEIDALLAAMTLQQADARLVVEAADAALGDGC